MLPERIANFFTSRNEFDLLGDGGTDAKEQALFDYLDTNHNGILDIEDRPPDNATTAAVIERVYVAGYLRTEQYNRSQDTFERTRLTYESASLFTVVSKLAPATSKRRADACNTLEGMQDKISDAAFSLRFCK